MSGSAIGASNRIRKCNSDDLDQDAGRRFLERPDYIHSLGPGFQVMETNLAAVAIDGLLRGPRDWQAPTTRGHDNKIAIRAAFEVADVTVMRQNFGHSSRFAAVSKIAFFGARMMIEFAVCMIALQAKLASKPDNERKSNNGVTNQGRRFPNRRPADAAKPPHFCEKGAEIASQKRRFGKRRSLICYPRRCLIDTSENILRR